MFIVNSQLDSQYIAYLQRYAPTLMAIYYLAPKLTTYQRCLHTQDQAHRPTISPTSLEHISIFVYEAAYQERLRFMPTTGYT